MFLFLKFFPSPILVFINNVEEGIFLLVFHVPQNCFLTHSAMEESFLALIIEFQQLTVAVTLA